MSRSLDDLLPQVKEKAEEFCAECKKQGIDVLITFTWRSDAEQNALYNQPWDGKDNDGDGLIDEADEQVTKAKAGESWHGFRRAFDVVPIKDGKAWWKAPESVWKKMGRIGQGLGLEWGGAWPKFHDMPHFQYTEGLTLAQARANTVTG